MPIRCQAGGHDTAKDADSEVDTARIDVSLTRTNASGEHSAGTVYDAQSDAWHYSWMFLAEIDQDGEFRVVTENYNLKKKGK